MSSLCVDPTSSRCDGRSVLQDAQESAGKVLEKLERAWKEIAEGEDRLEVPSSKLRFEADLCHKLSNSRGTIQHMLQFEQQESHMQASGHCGRFCICRICYSVPHTHTYALLQLMARSRCFQLIIQECDACKKVV